MPPPRPAPVPAKGLIRRVQGAAGVAAEVPGGVEEVVREELARYQEAAAAGRDLFGKTVFPSAFDPEATMCECRVRCARSRVR